MSQNSADAEAVNAKRQKIHKDTKQPDEPVNQLKYADVQDSGRTETDSSNIQEKSYPPRKMADVSEANAGGGGGGGGSDTNDNGDSYIEFNVVYENILVPFKTRRTTRMHAVRRALARQLSIDENSVRMLCAGERVDDNATLGSLEIEEGDVIDAVAHQTGG